MKKSKIKKELAEVKNRLDKLEKFASDNTTVSVFEKLPNVKGVSESGVLQIEEEFVLPEKWCVAVTKQNVDVLSEWRGNSALKTGRIYGYVHENYTWADIVMKGYTEITYDQFQKHVLKEDDLTPVERALENKPNSIRDFQVDVSKCSENEFNELLNILEYNGEETSGSMSRDKLNKCLQFNHDDNPYWGVYREYDLKKITPQQFKEMFGKKEIDWSKAGQLVVNDNGNVFIVLNDVDKFSFKGRALIINGKINTQYQDDEFDKSAFQLCNEPITLQND